MQESTAVADPIQKGADTVVAALLADSASQPLARALRAAAADAELTLDVFDADYDQIEHHIRARTSRVYEGHPHFVIIFECVERLLKAFQNTPLESRAGFADQHLAHVRSLVETLESGSPSQVIYFNFPELNDGVFGSYGNHVRHSWIYQLRTINRGLMDLAQTRSNLLIYDLALLATEYGYGFLCDRRFALTHQMTLSSSALPIVARRVIDIVAAQRGRAKKCLVLDLDNTLWGGVIGDDGVEGIEVGDYGLGPAFSELQAWAKQLQERGILLAVCSKNENRTAREPFERHPDMVLRLDDFVAFVANWDNKSDSICAIKETLNIGFDSIVFVDDNPFEREQVRSKIAGISVPDLPEDPADYVPFLRSLNLFETSTFTSEDAGRTAAYGAEARREEVRTSFADEAAFLASLRMVATVEGLTDFNIPRVAQLSQRSNQFNLRTIRYSSEQLHAMAHSRRHMAFAFTLQDSLGSHGLVSVAVLEDREQQLFIGNWFMSCRVLKRGLERFVLNELVAAARQRGSRWLVGEYRRTAKNSLVQDHYPCLGFAERDGLWYLSVEESSPLTMTISKG